MNDNTKLEIAVEIMAAKIAKTSRENKEDTNNEIAKLMEEKARMYKYDKEIIEKIINIYGNEINKKG